MGKEIKIGYCNLPNRCQCDRKIVILNIGAVCTSYREDCPLICCLTFKRDEEKFIKDMRSMSKKSLEICRLREFCNNQFIDYNFDDEKEELIGAISKAGCFSIEKLSSSDIETLKDFRLENLIMKGQQLS